jgi:uncharacterized protein YcnI
MRRPAKVLIATAAVCAAAIYGVAPSVAHVIAMPETGAAGQFLAVSFWVPEGCVGSATRGVRIEIPADIRMAKPQPKSGWTLQIEKQPLTKPVATEGGPRSERVSAITWRGGSVTDDEFEQFTVLVRLPSQPGPVFFPVVQSCEKGEAKWIEVPGPDTAKHGLSYPAPVLKVTAAKEGHGH